MSSLTHQYTYPVRPTPIRPFPTTSKEVQWTSVYDDVFHQYIRTEGLEYGGTCNPAALTYAREAVIVDKTRRQAHSNTSDNYRPSPTFSRPSWTRNNERDIPGLLGPKVSISNGLSMSGLMICSSNDPTLAPSHADEMAREMYNNNKLMADTSRFPPTRRTPSPPLQQQHHHHHHHRQQRSSPSLEARRQCQRRRPWSKGQGVHSRKSSGHHQQQQQQQQQQQDDQHQHDHQQRQQQHEEKSVRRKSGGFVNYTPSDSEKLLTGVAPSGSNKTRARRDREAVEKRRRFSQAAVKAVVNAGGDLTELRDAGLVMG
jgi:hypothetical protein